MTRERLSLATIHAVELTQERTQFLAENRAEDILQPYVAPRSGSTRGCFYVHIQKTSSLLSTRKNPYDNRELLCFASVAIWK